MLKVVLARGRRPKKGGDLEVHKQNVVSLKLRLGEIKQSMWFRVDKSDNLQFK